MKNPAHGTGYELVFFIKNEMCRHLIGVNMIFNRICQKF
jgi:hypothetical protein